MNALRKNLALGALATALLATTPAFAASNYCDNDRDSRQYACDNWGGWSYRSWSGDWNGDDRRVNSGIYGYGWVFKTAQYYAFHVWLNNPYFTDTSATYGYYNDAHWELLAAINQNAAPSGWTSLGSGYSDQLAVWHNNSTTGADMVRGDYSYGLTAKTTKLEQPVRDRKLAAIQHKMLNAVDNFQDASGSFHISFANNGQSDDVDFEMSTKNASSFVRIGRGNGEVVEHAANGRSTIKLHPQHLTYELGRVARPAAVEGPRAYRNEKGEAVFVYRQDPTWAIGANEITLPQSYAFWLIGSDSKIVGQENLLGRPTTVIQGHHDAYLADKLGASTFKMWVDDATGVLLKLVGTDKLNRTVYFIDVKAIEFNTGRDLRPQIKAPTGWKNLRAGEN
ncbi:hypothetical protein [Lysobacter tyrosinilyticus]